MRSLQNLCRREYVCIHFYARVCRIVELYLHAERIQGEFFNSLVLWFYELISSLAMKNNKMSQLNLGVMMLSMRKRQNRAKSIHITFQTLENML